MLKLRLFVILPPVVLLFTGLAFSLINEVAFVALLQTLVGQLISQFNWLFSWSTFSFVLLVVAVYISPLGTRKIGGPDAVPILTRWRWFAITLCTTIATGILFWGTAEPIFHLRDYPLTGEPDPAFAMSTLFLHWTITPYAIYTVAGLAFALAYYNRKQQFSLGSMLFALRDRPVSERTAALVDSICLYALVAGMAASLGAGVLTLAGGMEQYYPGFSGPFGYGLICLAIVLAFILSAGSGLQRGIRWLSGFNFIGFSLLAVLIFSVSPTGELLELAAVGLSDFFINFLPRSTDINSGIPADWQQDWTIFNWANWFAWAPISALFLGRLSVGYTVRQFIRVNWLWTSLFGGVWMVIFGGSAIAMDEQTGGDLQLLLTESGAESIVYALFATLPGQKIIVPFFLLLVFLSYVTAADSNVSAMSALSIKGISPEHPEAPLRVKIFWGSVIGLVAWTMVSKAGLDGIRSISILGGFPAMLLIILVAIGLVRTMVNSFGPR
ncbi:BCCT transporter [Lewinellaceae bacterium SD302]|nr:BCCT transporter [Lewinellaceae bacterium SD302]